MKFGKLFILLVVVFSVFGGIYYFFNSPQAPADPKPPLANSVSNNPAATVPIEPPKPQSELANSDIMNILLLGIDRRSKAEAGYRTDIMILLSVNTKTNKVLLTSVPRDLWVQGAKINGLYVQSGWEGLQKAFHEITGQKPQRYILTDFEDFSWIIDAFGGVNVTVENTFTDSEYPVDATKTYQTISFTKGSEKLTGARALMFARSRHGSNGEGSDWMRMKRQHLILRGMLTAVDQPGSLFKPMVVERALEMVTKNRMDTNMVLSDAQYLWDFYKDKDKYTIESLFMDGDYVYNPPMSEYGGAWVLAPKGKSYTEFNKTVKNKLMGVIEEPMGNTTPQTQSAPQL